MDNKVNRFKELRINNNLTQKDLFNKIGIPIRTIQDIESRNDKDIKTSNLIKYAKYFNVSTDYLLGLVDKEH